MKIKNITDIDKFFETIEQCKGKVELVTSEGDRINLKSKLCQYIMMSKLFSDAKIDEVEIIASEPEDLHRILDYLVRA
ncbi:MAG TPA: polya polymerase [Clostridiales bacterium]|nr:polya polymerase [Clostridiales bacterium]